jgi:hypothetical protein
VCESHLTPAYRGGGGLDEYHALAADEGSQAVSVAVSGAFTPSRLKRQALGFGTLKYPCNWVEKSQIFVLNQRQEELSYDLISAAAFAFF